MAYVPIFSNSWFGKALAGTLALAFADHLVPETAPWILAFVTLAIGLGHQWDVYARARFSPTKTQASPRQLRADAQRGNPWLLFAFCGMGRLSSTDGPVLAAHIQLAQEIMAREGLDQRARHRAVGWFNAGKDPSCPLSEIAELCVACPHPADEALVLESLGRCAAVRDGDGVADMLQGLGSLLRLRCEIDISASASAPLDDAAELLAVEVGESSEAIKLAYRRGVARYHPDRLPADATITELHHAQQRMTALREAYERLLAESADNRLVQPRTVRNSNPSVDRSA